MSGRVVSVVVVFKAYKMNNTQERERNGPRMSLSQMEKMLQLIEQKPELAASYLTTPSAKSKVKDLWNDAAYILNGQYGSLKTGEKWQKAWIDWKSKTLIKVRQLSAKGEAANLRKHLNAVELRLAAMLDSSVHLDQTRDGNVPFSLELHRDRKTTLSQLTTLLDMIEKQPELVVYGAGAGSSKVYDRECRRRAWHQLTRMLNADTNGPTRTALKWQKTLAAWKYKTRFKFIQYERKSKRRGKNVDFREKFTRIECRLAKLMGWIENDAEEGSDDGALISKAASSPSSSSAHDEADVLSAQQLDILDYAPEDADEACAEMRDVKITIKPSESPTTLSPLSTPPLEHRKTTLSQLTTLLDMIEKQPELVMCGAGPGSSKVYDRERRRRAWHHLTRMLNADTNGPTRTALKWQKTLSDWKYKTRFKFKQYERKLKRRGKKVDFREKFTRLECRLAKLMGWIENDAEEGSDDGALISKAASSPSSSSAHDEADVLSAQQLDMLDYAPEDAYEACAEIRDVKITIKPSESPTTLSPLSTPPLEHRKTTLSQLTTLLDMIEKQPELVMSDAGAGSSKVYDRECRRRAWHQLTRMLNADTNGPTRTALKWQKTLSDWKYKTRFKFKQYERKLKRRGKKVDFRDKFTRLECRLAKLMGWIENDAEEGSDDGALISKAASSPSSSSAHDELSAQQFDMLDYAPKDAAEPCAEIRDVKITIKPSESPTTFSPLSPSPAPAPEPLIAPGAPSEQDETINEFLQLERQKVAALRCMAEAVTGLRSDLQRYFTYLIDDHHKPFSDT